MTCLNRWVRRWTCSQALPLFCIFFLCGGVPYVVANNSTTPSSLKQYLVSNFTVCELNTTTLPGGYSFTYVEEYWVIAPFVCYLIGLTAKTLSLTCDLLVVVPLFGVAAHLEAYYLMALLLPTVVFLGGAFMYRLVITFMAWRYACTRHTSFVRDGSQIGAISSHVLLMKAGKVLTKSGFIRPSLVVLNGRRATELSSVSCEHFQ